MANSIAADFGPRYYWASGRGNIIANTCGKCGGKMTAGVNVDHGYATNYPERWQPGETKASFWFGLRENKKAQLDVETWRCDRCGFLESYAPDKIE